MERKKREDAREQRRLEREQREERARAKEERAKRKKRSVLFGTALRLGAHSPPQRVCRYWRARVDRDNANSERDSLQRTDHAESCDHTERCSDA